MMVAANTGISACIDNTGRIAQQGLRRDESVLYAQVPTAGESSWYQWVGDIPAAICLLFCVAVSIVGTRDLRHWRKSRNSPE
jgi:apolipoprotein N-acyltransferase